MNQACEIFKKKMEEVGIKYTSLDEKIVRVGFNGKSAPTITVFFVFDDDGKSVAIRINDICTCTEDKLPAMYELCSRLNGRFRWLKFYVNKDNHIVAEDDAVVSPETLGNECVELLMRAVNITDEAYPVIMRGLWGTP